MKHAEVFMGSSHPELSKQICENLGMNPGQCELNQFSNGETSVAIGTSVRDKAVFLIQSGCEKTNDSLIELMIMISACEGGSATKTTVVMPYFPYSRQSKRKSHRGAIAARLIANLLSMAGMHHIVTIDLHSPQLVGFFRQPVDNLSAQPLIVNWARTFVRSWNKSVVVSKNAGGTKRAASLADALGVNMGIITTDKRRWTLSRSSTSGSPMVDPMSSDGSDFRSTILPANAMMTNGTNGVSGHITHRGMNGENGTNSLDHVSGRETGANQALPIHARISQLHNLPMQNGSSTIRRAQTLPASPARHPTSQPDEADGDNITTGRLVQGHIVDDDYPLPPSLQGSVSNLTDLNRFMTSSFQSDSRVNRDSVMTASFMSATSSAGGGGGGGGMNGSGHLGTAGASGSDDASEDEEENLKNPEVEHEITLVGNVRDKTVLIVDDIIDKAGSWIAAAECCVKRGGAKAVLLFATHGLFAGGEGLRELEECECVDRVVVTNSYPIPKQVAALSSKLVVLDVSSLLAAAIRRNHHGESMSQLCI